MREVDLKNLKKKLGEYIRVAASGETVLIREGDRIVAELNPPRQDRTSNMPDAALAELVREGILTPALIVPGTEMPARHPIGVSFAALLAELDEDRSDR